MCVCAKGYRVSVKKSREVVSLAAPWSNKRPVWRLIVWEAGQHQQRKDGGDEERDHGMIASTADVANAALAFQRLDSRCFLLSRTRGTSVTSTPFGPGVTDATRRY